MDFGMSILVSCPDLGLVSSHTVADWGHEVAHLVRSNADSKMLPVYSTNMNTLNSSYIDPATIGGQETTPRSQLAQIQPVRAYPGMHTQQAAQAKAQVGYRCLIRLSSPRNMLET